MLNAGGTKVPQDLSGVLVEQRFAGLEFQNEDILDQQIDKVVAQNRSVFIQNLEGMLLFHIHTRLPKSVSQAVLINFFHVPVPQIAVEGEACLSHLITQLEYFVGSFHHHPLCVFCAFSRPKFQKSFRK
ncbi:MAG: hypothetical protein RL324_2237 [Verrucomicrobiota bacterium]